MTTLKKGSRGQEVKTLQQKLNLIPDGIFGPITQEAVMAFQKSKGLTADGIVGPKTWAALGVTNPRNIKKIILHCSATPEGKDFTVAQIREWHVKGNGWSDIGYHFVIYRDGSVHIGRSENIVGAHCEGQNTNSIGICYIGGLSSDGKTPKDTRTPAQRASMIKLINELQNKYGQHVTVHGHYQFANKACPSFKVPDQL